MMGKVPEVGLHVVVTWAKAVEKKVKAADAAVTLEKCILVSFY